MAVAILAVAAQYQRNAPHQLANVEQRTPRDSSDLREAIKARADLLTCSDAPRMTLARVDNGHCARASTMPRNDDACYLLSREKVLGSVRSLECVGLKPRRSTPLPDRNLPEYPGWGFLAADCWGYARVRRRPFRPADLHPPGDPITQRLAEDAATEWSHPASKRVRAGLRVAIYGRCIPFLLDDLPHELSVGRMRRDTIATTVTRLGHNGYDEQRRVVAVSRVVVDAAASSALSYARQAHRRVLTPVAQLTNEGGPLGGALAHLFGDDDAFDGDLFNRRAGGRSVLAVHLVVVSLNLWLAVRVISRLAPHLSPPSSLVRLLPLTGARHHDLEPRAPRRRRRVDPPHPPARRRDDPGGARPRLEHQALPPADPAAPRAGVGRDRPVARAGAGEPAAARIKVFRARAGAGRDRQADLKVKLAARESGRAAIS